jgi:dTDP-4-amino-4,6-dideoxygalactose transaminase
MAEAMTRQAPRRIPLADPKADLAHLRSEILAAVARVLDGGSYILGPEVADFERDMARRIGVPGAVGVASGTDALVLALRALRISDGDEVITVSHTAGPTVAAIHMVGAVPVLVDIDPATYCLDPDALDHALSARTKAILPVHLYGHPADLDRICAFAQAHRVAVIEDCAQAQTASVGGRDVGSIGDIGCFSFYPTKNLGAIGDGGLVVSSDQDIVERLRQLRTYGWTKPQFAEVADGRCSRLDELQAAVLNVKLDGLAGDMDRRREIAAQYAAAFADLPLVRPLERAGCRHAYHLYVVRCERREALANHLDRLGIATGLHYPYPVHAQPALAAGARIPRPLQITEEICRQILTLPLYPSMPKESVSAVIDGVRGFFATA